MKDKEMAFGIPWLCKQIQEAQIAIRNTPNHDWGFFVMLWTGLSKLVPVDFGLNALHPPSTLYSAHILDNKLKSFSVWAGGGPSDELVKFVGGKPSGLRWANTDVVTSSIPQAFQWPGYPKKGYYGNNSTADYFAEAFAWSIYDPSIVPGSNSEVKTWIDSLISLTAP